MTDPFTQHRPEVVRRLLEAGLRRETLLTLLPEWKPIIRSMDDIASTRRGGQPQPCARHADLTPVATTAAR